MKKRVLAAIAVAALLFGICGGMSKTTMVQAAVKQPNLEVQEGAETEIDLIAGEVTYVEIPVKAKYEVIFNPRFAALLLENAPFEIEDIKVYQKNVWGQSDFTHIGLGDGAILSFYVKTKDTAKIGSYELVLQYEELGLSGVEIDREYLQGISLMCNVTEEKMPPEFGISDVKLTGDLKPGETVTLSFKVTNTGELTAKSVRLYADYSAGVLLPAYTEYTKKLGDMKEKDTKELSLKVKLLENVTQKVVQLPLVITYKDSEGESYTVGENNILYLETEQPEQEVTELGTLLISNVRQSPSRPKAGERVSVTFDMENTGEKDYTDTKLYMEYVPNTGFEPVKAEPYQYVGTIKAGAKKSVTVTVVAGKDIAAGMNELGVSYTYENANKQEESGSMRLYVLNVQKTEESDVISKPKLMVSEFAASKEVVKSGEEFDFTFKVYNTHEEIKAKNIKVTVTGETFSVTKGSNSFFIREIAPGDGNDITINLKASAAATTGSYPVNIQMEYEYDGMPAAEANAGGVDVTETKMLLIKENLRVSVENAVIGGWQTPFVNQPTQLSFSIYNMGKSMLNNVFFTVEGDFSVANGSSYYYGTLQAGYPDYVEMDIMPLVAGEAKGVLTVHMEDSNGDEVTYEAEISGFVAEIETGNMGMDEPWEDLPVDVLPQEEPKDAPLLPLPALIAGQIAAFLLAFFVARGIRIACYKRKLRKEEE